MLARLIPSTSFGLTCLLATILPCWAQDAVPHNSSASSQAQVNVDPIDGSAESTSPVNFVAAPKKTKPEKARKSQTEKKNKTAKKNDQKKKAAKKKATTEQKPKEELPPQESSPPDEAREAFLSSGEMREAIAWSEANLSVRAGDGPQLAAQLKKQISNMSLDQLQAFLADYHFQRSEVLRQEQEFQQQRSQSFDKAFSYHLQMQQMAMQTAANRKAATFKQFDSGQDRYNNGFHGYTGPPAPLFRGGFFFRAY